LTAFAALATLAPAHAVEELEVELLLEALFQRHGFDFRGYDRGLMRRKLLAVMGQRGLRTLSGLQEQMLHQAGAASAVLRALALAPAPLFADPQHALRARGALGASLRAAAVPRVWLAECGGVGAAWTLAILLQEEGVLARTEMFATLANEDLLADAQAGSIDVAALTGLQEDYARSGGTGVLADYFEVTEGRAALLPELRAHLTWAGYNLVTDASFNEFQAIVCCHALADFGPALRQRVLRLFHESLARFGVLGLGSTLAPEDDIAPCYQALGGQPGWYKRIG